MESTIDAMKLAVHALGQEDIQGAQNILWEAIASEEAQTVEPSGFALAAIGCKHFGNPIPQEWYAAARELLSSSPTPATEPAKPLYGKRKELVDGLRESATIVESDGWSFGDELREAADMLAADAQALTTSNAVYQKDRIVNDNAQQVAMPQESVGYLAMDGYFIANQRYVMEFGQVPRAKPFYLAAAPQPPQANAPRVPMTDDELRQCRLETEYDGTPSEPFVHRSTHSRFAAFARAVEKFHGIGVKS